LVLTDEDIARVQAGVDAVVGAFGEELQTAADRFKHGEVLSYRFKAATQSSLKNCRDIFGLSTKLNKERVRRSLIKD
jgi:hypothetical protein